MKFRNGFVSNSSSSSFIVIGRNKEDFLENLPHLLWKKVDVSNRMILPFTYAQLEFGWQFERYRVIEDRINFVVALFMGVEDNEKKWKYKSMFEKVIREHFMNTEAAKAKESGSPFFFHDHLDIRYDYNYYNYDSIIRNYSYIDHQSTLGEGENTELFESEKNLEDFIFNDGSFIQCGNDNSDYTKEWLEARELRQINLGKHLEKGKKYSFGKCDLKYDFSPNAYLIIENCDDRGYDFPDDEKTLIVYDGDTKTEVDWDYMWRCEDFAYNHFTDIKEIVE